MRRFGLLLSAPLALVLTVPGLSRADFHVDCIGIATGHATVRLVANPDGRLTFSGILNCPNATSLSIDVLELRKVSNSNEAFSPFIDPCNPDGMNPSGNFCTIPPTGEPILEAAPSVSCSGVVACLEPVATRATTAGLVLAGTYQVGMLVSVNVGGSMPHPFALRFGRWDWSGSGQPTITCAPLGGPPGSTGFCT